MMLYHKQNLSTESLQNFSYQYDSVGNILSIADSVNSQAQTFGYDELNRLTSASASGTQAEGGYNETTQYDPATGNLKIKGDLTLDYLDSSHVHAVTNANSNTLSVRPQRKYESPRGSDNRQRANGYFRV